jgi:hypothetical protein
MRTIIIGGPRTGKSTLAQKLEGPIYCTDPKHVVKEPQDNVTYGPDAEWGDDSDWVAKNWLGKPGPWTLEGHAAVRALRKYNGGDRPCDRIIVLKTQYYYNEGQRRLHKGVMTVWDEIKDRYSDLVEDVRHI